MTSRREFIKKTSAGVAVVSLAGLTGCGPSLEQRRTNPLGGRVIDAHLHVVAETIPRCLEVMDHNHIRYGISIGLTGDQVFYQFMDAVKPYKNRLGAMYAFDWKLAETDPDFFAQAPDMLERAVKAGAVGWKNFKELGLKAKDQTGKLIAIDDPRLDPLWERARQLKTIVAFHTTDPKAFFEALNPQNERWGELGLHPEWSFADRSKYPPRDVLLEQRNNVIRKYPEITFHCCHVANNPEDLKTVIRWMEELPNLHLDVAARLGELGRHPANQGRELFNRFPDRIMFGTDRMFWKDCEVQGAGPCVAFTGAQDLTFYQTHWRYFQTDDTQFDHPTPIQGKWKIDGIGLKQKALEKLYWDNAYRLYKLDQYGVA